MTKYLNYIGKPLVDLKSILSQSEKENMRILKPDQPATMEYKPFRLNVTVEDSGLIRNITWG